MRQARRGGQPLDAQPVLGLGKAGLLEDAKVFKVLEVFAAY